jgi:hypothetical protein
MGNESGNARLASDFTTTGVFVCWAGMIRENDGHRVFATCCFISSYLLLHPSVEADLVAGRTRGCMPLWAIRIVVFTNRLPSALVPDGRGKGNPVLSCTVLPFVSPTLKDWDADMQSFGFFSQDRDRWVGLLSWRKRSHSRN